MTCMVSEFIYTLMDTNMKDNTWTIRRRGMEFIFGQMVESTRDGGTKVNSTGLALITIQQSNLKSGDCGSMARESSGITLKRLYRLTHTCMIRSAILTMLNLQLSSTPLALLVSHTGSTTLLKM